MDTSKLTEQITLWSQKNDSTYLGDFVILTGMDPDNLDEYASQDPEFCLALKHAKLRIAKRLRSMLGKKGYSATLFAREIGMYDLLLAKYELIHLRAEQQIKKDMGESTNFTSLLEKISKMEDEESKEPLEAMWGSDDDMIQRYPDGRPISPDSEKGTIDESQ